MALDYPTAVTCNNAGKKTLTEKLEKRISAINKKWNFCIDVYVSLVVRRVLF